MPEPVLVKVDATGLTPGTIYYRIDELGGEESLAWAAKRALNAAPGRPGAPARQSAWLIEFRLLGPLEAVEDGRPLPLGGRQQRAVLAALLLHANELVPAERLIDLVWGERPPPTAATVVQVYVSRLRKLLGRELLVTRAPGYLLQVDPDQIDVRRAERLIAAGHETQEPARRSALLRDALALWHCGARGLRLRGARPRRGRAPRGAAADDARVGG